MAAIAGVVPIPNSDRLQFACPECGKECGRLDQLKAHVNLEHLVYMPYRCTICEFACFPTRNTLLNHLEQHDLVAGEWEDPRKRTVRIYRLTESGVQELARLKSIVRPKLEEAVEVLQDLVDDLDGGANHPKQKDNSGGTFAK